MNCSTFHVTFNESNGYIPKYTHAQTTPAEVWIVQHGLKTFPNVTVVDDNRNVIIADIVYTDENTVTITFSEPMTGYVYCGVAGKI